MNGTMVPPSVHATNTNSSNSSTPGLAAGLTFFFLLLVIVVGVIVYKYHSKIRNMVQFRQRRSQEKEDYSEATQDDDSHRYASMYTEQPMTHTPVYENLTRNKDYNSPAISQSRLSGEPEEDLYLECDIADDAIYNNDPECNLSMLPDSQEEDVYVVPDS